MRACCFINADKFINCYTAEGILCNCLEAASRLQSWLQYLSTTRAGCHAITVHKTCIHNINLCHLNCFITINNNLDYSP